MRVVKNPQLQFGEVDISAITFTRSRDDIPQLLKGLQYIYVNPSLREEIFNLLEKKITPGISKRKGRPGMELWRVLVLGVLRLALNCDYDRMEELANNHIRVRLMLGHSEWDNKTGYAVQTLKDNMNLFTPELLDEINQIVVRTGHVLVKKKQDDVLRGRCDSFVFETNVHYPTDINLLWDAMRKTIQLTAQLCKRYEWSDYRQSGHTLREVKSLMRNAQNKKRSKAKKEEQKRKRKIQIENAHRRYIQFAQLHINKAKSILEKVEKQGLKSATEDILIDNIKHFITHAQRQVEQIDRRVLRGEIIAHNEKVFSIFQPHTEWICKGKAGVPVELGVRVCILEDQYQFILHHQVMEKKTDEAVAVSMTEETQQRFPGLRSLSFDKGFHSPENQSILSEKLDTIVMSRKGRLSKKTQAIESTETFRKIKRKHSGVESAINGLEVHGLDVCLDSGIIGFKRYTAFAIVARNIQRIGAILQKQEREREERRRRKYNSRDGTYKLAA